MYIKILTISSNDLENVYDEGLMNINNVFVIENFNPIIVFNNNFYKIEFKCSKPKLNLELSTGEILNSEDELKNKLHNKILSGTILFEFSRIIRDESIKSKFSFVLVPIYIKIKELSNYDKFKSIKDKAKASF